MASIGTANLTIVPKFDGLTASVNRALSQVDASAGGQRMGKGLSDGVERGTQGLARQGAVMGVFSTMASKAMDAVASHVGSAASRLDTLKNYPVTMQALGYSADASQASIQRMSDRLSNLPTRLDDMARTVQGLVAITGDLDKATDVGLAMNDMFLASGASTELATAAGEQFRQMLSKGKPEMQDWKSLVSAAPGQMDQLAKAMLGPTASANDLYAALGGGKNTPTVTMDQLLDKIVELDTKGGAGITSFKDQAETASGGLQTSFENMGNAVTKGLANVMDAVGRDTISGFLNDVKGGINDVFKGVVGVTKDVTPVLKGAWDVAKRLVGDLKPLVPAIAAVATAMVGLKAAKGAFGAVSTDMQGLGRLAGRASEVLLGLGEKMSGPLAEGALRGATGLSSVASVLSGPWGVAIAAGVAGVSLLVGHIMEARQKQDNLTSAVSAFNDVTAKADGLDSYSGRVDALGESSSNAKFDIEDLTDKMKSHADAMSSNMETAEGTIATWQTVQSTIDSLAGSTSLTTEEQGRLQWALDQVNQETGESISLEDALSGKYTDQNGQVQSLRDTVDQLAQSRIAAAKADAYSQNLTEAYKAQADASEALTKAQGEYNAKVDEYIQKYGLTHEQAVAAMSDNEQAKSDLDAAKAAYDSANGAVEKWSGLLGDAGAAADGAADGVEAIKSALGGLGGEFDSALVGSGTSLTEFAQKCADAGISTGELQTIGTENLAALAQACSGDVQQMVDTISTYNDVPIIDKDGNVTVDQTHLWDAQGNVYTWNGTELQDKTGAKVDVDDLQLEDAQGNLVTWNGSDFVDKHAATSVDVAALADAQGMVWVWDGSSLKDQYGNAAVDDTSVMDAQGNLYTWNGSHLVRQSGTADVTDPTVLNAISHINSYNRNPPKNHHATTVIDVVRNTFNNIFHRESATGSVSNAAYIPRHAAGYIATGPTLTNNGWVGEDGAEAVMNWATGGAVVPLTNYRYMEPIAEAIAQNLDRGGAATVPETVNNYYLDGATFNDLDIMNMTALELLASLKRRAEMSVG